MTIRNAFVLIMLLVVLLAGCSPPSSLDQRLSQIPDTDVRRVLKKAIDKAGGWTSWETLKQISYVKKSILYLEDGTVESEVNQSHRYILQPDLKGSITWSDSLGNHEILYSPDGASKVLNGTRVPDSEKSASESFMSAVYVLFMPFKLMDPGAQLTYQGLDTLDTGRSVETIMATYDPDTHDNHSTSDVWYFYFDADSGEFVANMVYHAPTYAYIENKEFTTDQPIVLQTYRESWRTDGARKKVFLRGVFFYGDYVLE